MEKRPYEKFSDQEINDLLEAIPQENWSKNEELLKEGIMRYIKLFVKKD